MDGYSAVRKSSETFANKREYEDDGVNWNPKTSKFPLDHLSSSTADVFSRTTPAGKHGWGLLIIALSLFHMAEAYISVSMSSVCQHNPSRSIKLAPEAALTLQLDASNSPVLRPEEVKMCLDLCSEEAFKSVEPYTDLLPPKVTLEWNPSVKDSDEILASEIVIAAVGRGRDICSQEDQFLCKSIGYPVYCISKELVCDGKRNCPFEGRDEDKEMCSAGDAYEKIGFGLGEGTHVGRGWEFLASEFLKKFTLKEGLPHPKRFNVSSSTEKSSVLWSESGTIQTRDSESLPDVLKHYGPWGYLMLGMLICGTVLMFCGLWECCCRRPKALVSNAVGPALLIINQGPQQSELEVPSSPGPPRYEELDQPPSYSTLFPPSKTESVNSTTNSSLPITLPIVNSISNTLSNNLSSQVPPPANLQSQETVNTNNRPPPPISFAIDVQNTTTVDTSREINNHETRPK